MSISKSVFPTIYFRIMKLECYFEMKRYNCHQRTLLGDVAVFENRQPVTDAKFTNKS